MKKQIKQNQNSEKEPLTKNEKIVWGLIIVSLIDFLVLIGIAVSGAVLAENHQIPLWSAIGLVVCAGVLLITCNTAFWMKNKLDRY